MSLMQRSKEAAQFQEWERQEDQFHLEQARLRSRIRIQDGRGKYFLIAFCPFKVLHAKPHMIHKICKKQIEFKENLIIIITCPL